MLDELESLLHQAYTVTDNDHLGQILQAINSLQGQLDFYVSLIHIISSSNYSDSIRHSACVQLRISISKFWANGFSDEVKKTILQSVPKFLLGFSPPLFPSLSYLMEVLIKVSLYGDEWPFFQDIINKFLSGDLEHVKSGLLLFRSLLKASVRSNTLQLSDQLANHISQIIWILPNILFNTNNIFIQYLCVSSASTCAKIYPRLLLGNFAPWAQTVEILSRETTLTKLNAALFKFLNSLIKVYRRVMVSCRCYLPMSVELLSICFPLILKKWDVPIAHLQINVFDFFAKCCHNSEAYPLLYISIPGIISEYFVPLFVLKPAAIQQAQTDPTQFVLDNFVDSIYPAENDVLSSAYYALVTLAYDFTEVSNLIFCIMTSKLDEYFQIRNGASLYGAFHMCSCNFSNLVACRREETFAFIGRALPILKSDDVLAQCAVLVLLNNINKIPAVEIGDFDPQIIQYLIQLIGSSNSLVHYFATKAFSSLYNCHNYSPVFVEVMREMCSASIVDIIGHILKTSKDFGDSQITEVINVFVKDPFFVERLIQVLPEIVQISFDLAMFYIENTTSSRHCYDVLSSLINLVNQLDGKHQEEEQVCQIMLRNCAKVVNNISNAMLNTFIDLLCSVVHSIPVFWVFFQWMFPKLENEKTRSDPNILNSIALFSHDLFLRDPQKALQELDLLLQLGMSIMGLSNLVPTSIYNSAILAIVHDHTLPEEYFLQLARQLSQVSDSLDNSLMGSEIKYFSPFFLLLLRYDADRIFPIVQAIYVEWTSLVNVVDIAYSLVYTFRFLPRDVALRLLNEVLRESPKKLLESSDFDVNDQEYENDTKPIPPIPLSERFDGVLTFLKKLIVNGVVDFNLLPNVWKEVVQN